MPSKLCAPVIGGTLSNLSTAVFVSNCIPGATVFVRSLTRPGDTLVKAQAGATDGYLPLAAGAVLQAGDQLVASQQDGTGAASQETNPKLAVTVGPAPASALDIPPVDITGRLWECGLFSFVGNASPGLTVEVVRNGAVIGSAVAQDGIARVGLTNRYVKWDQVKVRQRNGGAIGPETPRQAEPLPVKPGELMPPPVVGSAVCECLTAIRVDGVYEGAQVTVARKSGESETAGFDLAGLWFNLATPFKVANGWVKVSQAMPGCERKGQEVTVPVGPAVKPGTPYVYPLCAGMAWVFIDNVDRGAEVHIKAGGDEYVTIASGAGMNRFDVAPLSPGQITVQVFACGLGSDVVTATVDVAPAQIDVPVIVGDLVKCQRSVPVDKLKPGALVQIWSKGPRLAARPISAQVLAGGSRIDVPVVTLIEDADVWAVQWACNMLRLESPPKQVKPAPVVTDPSFTGPVTRIDTSVLVKGTIRDARVEILRLLQNEDWLVIGAATAMSSSTQVPLNVTLAVNDLLKVRQRYCAVQSPGNQQTTVVKPVPLQPVILAPPGGSSITVGTAVNISWKDVASGADADRKADTFDVTVSRDGTQVLNLSQPGTTATLAAVATTSFSSQFTLTVTPRNSTGVGPSAVSVFHTPKAPDPIIAAVQDGAKIRVTGSNFAASHQVEIQISTDFSQLAGGPGGTTQVVDNRSGKTSTVSSASGTIDVSFGALDVLEPRQEPSGQTYKAAPYPTATMKVTARNMPPITASQGSANPSNTVTFSWSA